MPDMEEATQTDMADSAGTGSTIRLPELLSPAGSPEAVEAAVMAGADAVYAGGRMLNARMNAKNLDDGALAAAVSFCHDAGAKLYITLNTLVLDREMKEALRYASGLAEAGVDALIVTDAGLIRRLRDELPSLALHGSTQMSGHSAAAAREMYAMGLSRMVCAREMTADDIRRAASESPIGLEIFVHGALCVCASGQCLASSLIGGRSGNRGECAQPCRLPYNGAYPLSLRDLCLAGRMREVVASGAMSLKIEGRMKSPAYVAGVTGVYRRLLDEGRDATPDEIKSLAALFSRGGFTDGYFTGIVAGRPDGRGGVCHSDGMTGVRSEADKAATRAVNYSANDAVYAVKNPHPCGKPVENCGEAVLNTGVPAPKNGNSGLKFVKKICHTALFASPEQIPQGCVKTEIEADASAKKEEWDGIFDAVFLPLSLYRRGAANGVALPEVITDAERPIVRKRLEEAVANGARYCLVGNFGHLSLLRELPLTVMTDFRFNICNGEAYRAVTSAAAEYSSSALPPLLSPELTLPQIRDIIPPKSVIVYGHIPLMILHRDPGARAMRDRRGVTFQVCRACPEGEWLLYNSVPIWMADRDEALGKSKIGGRHFIFSSETRAEAAEVILAYRHGRTNAKQVRRIR